jgi:hypothetical protein
MNWKPPESEDAWQECLSAYIDGELAQDEKKALELYLMKNPERAEQLDELQKLGALLPEWEIHAPAPDRILEEKILSTVLRGKSREKYSSRHVLPWKLIWGFHAAVFFLGVFIGGIIMSMFIKTSKAPPITERHLQTLTPSIPAEKTSTIISDSQAEILLKEIGAAQLKDKMIEEIRKNNWEQASALYKSLREQYRDTKAWKDLENDKSLGTIKKLPFSRRFIDEIM